MKIDYCISLFQPLYFYLPLCLAFGLAALEIVFLDVVFVIYQVAVFIRGGEPAYIQDYIRLFHPPGFKAGESQVQQIPEAGFSLADYLEFQDIMNVVV